MRPALHAFLRVPFEILRPPSLAVAATKAVEVARFGGEPLPDAPPPPGCIMVEMPAGAEPGEELEIEHGGQTYSLPCPSGVAPGGFFSVALPAEDVPAAEEGYVPATLLVDPTASAPTFAASSATTPVAAVGFVVASSDPYSLSPFSPNPCLPDAPFAVVVAVEGGPLTGSGLVSPLTYTGNLGGGFITPATHGTMSSTNPF
jgi:hypothetical protein